MKIIKLVSTMNGQYIEDIYAKKVYFINQGIFVHEKNFWFNINTTGLSKSRNYALSLLNEGDIGIISDNDVILCDNYERKIKNAFELYPDADILTFKTKNKDNSDFHKYKNNSFRHNLFSIMKVCSIEIVIKKSSKLPLFDTQYGLGANISTGEENIFLSDAIKRKLNIYFIPEYLSIHNDTTHSGNNFNKKKNKERNKVFCRIYGKFWGKIILIAFNIKNIKKIISTYNSKVNK